MKIAVPGHADDAFVYTGGRVLEGDEPVVVMVHGAQNDHCVWALQSRYLANHGYRVLAVDLPGHGASRGRPLPTIAAMADWLDALLTTAGVERASLVGHSMGSLISLEFAARYHARVTRLVLVGSAVPMPVSDALLAAAEHDEPAAIGMICEWSHSGLGHWPGPGFSMYMMAKRLMERQPPGTLFNDLRACNEYDGGFDAIASLTCPALVIGGSADLMTPVRAASGLVDALRDRSVAIGQDAPSQVVLADCGHNLMAEKPGELLGHLKAFLATPTRVADTVAS